MEASGLGGGAEGVSEATQTDNGQQAPVEQAPARDFGPDVDRLSQTMEQMRSSFEEYIQSQQPAEEPEAEPEFDPSEYMEGETLTAEGLQQMIQAQAEHIADQKLKPLQDQWTQAQQDRVEQQRASSADALEQQYPELQDEAYADQIIDMATAKATELAQSMGKPELAELWREPSFLETIHLAEKARAAAENEVPAGGGGGLQLESGGSLSPGGAGTSDEDIVNRIVKARV